MLNKELCEKCHNAFGSKKSRLVDWGWCGEDERFWDRKLVQCPHISPVMIVNIDKIPAGCPYSLEHAVLAGMKHAKH
jgi:hypothetical protein